VARELKSNPFYTGEKLISECQKAIDKYGISVKLVYVYVDNNYTIGHKYKTPKGHRQAWTLLESGGAWAYVDCSNRPRNGTLPEEVLELLRWLIYSNPNESANLAECASYLAAMSSMATQPPLQTIKGKEAFVCSKDGEPFVFFDSREPQNELIISCITKTTGDDNALKHFEKYPDCQWIMVWDDVLGAIQMAARDHAHTNEVGDICSRVAKFDSNETELAKPVSKTEGWTQKELLSCVDGSFSEKTFTRVREDAGIKSSESGGEGSHRKYDGGQLKRMIAALKVSRRHNKKSIIEAWEKKCEDK